MEPMPGLSAPPLIKLPADVTPKRIALRAAATSRAWVGRLAARLTRDRHAVRVERTASDLLPESLDWLLHFERLATRSGGDSFTRDASTDASASGDVDLIVDLASDAPDGDTPTLRLQFAGGDGEVGLVDALLAMTTPELTLVITQRGAQPKTLRHAHLGVEQPLNMGPALDAVTARVTTLVADAIARWPNATEADDRPATLPRSAITPLAFAAATLNQKIWRQIDRRLRRADDWRIATRIAPVGDGLLDRLAWGGSPWRLLPDDAKRYYADPFLFAHKGKSWLFCEEYPHATGVGILSAAPVADDGTVGTPRPILETGTHLSWPNIFAHAGQIYMVPESAAAGRVELWRAADFPRRWELDRVLIPALRAHDPVLHFNDAGAFMLANVDGDGGSSWDALALFTAPNLFGPWQAHPDNPLLVDVTSTRGASPLLLRGGELWRAVQDCSDGYGSGMALCRVTKLDRTGFAQDVVARLAPPPGSGAKGAHTLSRLGTLEAIDVLAPRGNFGRA